MDILIIDIFSSAVYMGSGEMGMPVAAFQSEPGKYHTSCYLETAPYAMLKQRFAAVRPILEAAGEAVIVCILPLLRFVLRTCCDNSTHISNFKDTDFEDILKSAATSCYDIISAESEKAGLALYTFSAVSAFRGRDKLSSKTSSAGMSVWRSDDPVHLTAAAYRDIARVLEAQANLATEGQTPCSRRRVNSVVPGPTSGPEQVTVAEPGWISRTERPTRGAATLSGQRWNCGRGCGKRSYPFLDKRTEESE